MITMQLPRDMQVRAAIGAVAVRHGQHDYGLRMVIKTVGGITNPEAVYGTWRQGSQKLRELAERLKWRKAHADDEP